MFFIQEIKRNFRIYSKILKYIKKKTKFVLIQLRKTIIQMLRTSILKLFQNYLEVLIQDKIKTKYIKNEHICHKKQKIPSNLKNG